MVMVTGVNAGKILLVGGWSEENGIGGPPLASTELYELPKGD